jgi:hypothetical protein
MDLGLISVFTLKIGGQRSNFNFGAFTSTITSTLYEDHSEVSKFLKKRLLVKRVGNMTKLKDLIIFYTFYR